MLQTKNEFQGESKMKESTKRLIMFGVGMAILVGYLFYEDTPIMELELHQIFMVAVILFFTGLNGGRYLSDYRKEHYKKWSDRYEGG